MKINSMLYSTFNSFRAVKIIGFYAYLQNFDLYDYHKLNYDGILKQVLDFLRYIKDKQWEIIPINPIPDIYDQIWFEKFYFIDETNPNFTSS